MGGPRWGANLFHAALGAEGRAEPLPEKKAGGLAMSLRGGGFVPPGAGNSQEDHMGFGFGFGIGFGFGFVQGISR